MDQEPQKKAATVAVIGRPSAGKSTLLNALCGEKVAIVSPVPQTTRNAVRGIVNGEAGQLVFLDTPGWHVSEKKLNRKLQEVATRQLAEADLVLYVLDSSREPGQEEKTIAAMVAPYAARLVVAINKIDAADSAPAAARLFVAAELPDLAEGRVLDVSAKEKTGIEALKKNLFVLAPIGEAMYDPDYYTDQEVEFRIAEIIREKAINRLRDELPHALFVEIADAELKDEGTRLWVRAFIVVERDSQVGIVVGKGGEMIKAIRIAAKRDCDRIFDWKIDLDLRVKVSKDWRQDDRILKRLISK